MQNIDLTFAQKSCFSIIYSTLRMFHIQTQKIFDTRQYNANIIEDSNIKDRLLFCIPNQLLCMGSSGGLNRKQLTCSNPFLLLHLISHNQYRNTIRRAFLLYSTGIGNAWENLASKSWQSKTSNGSTICIRSSRQVPPRRPSWQQDSCELHI